MSDSLHPNWLAETLSIEVLTDLPCRKCGYNLRTLSTAGLCPECATPVALSLRQDLLRYADPAWLAGLRGGLFQFRWSLLVVMLSGFVLSMSSGIYPVFGLLRPFHFRNFNLGLVAPIAMASELIAIWRITMPDPAGIDEEKSGRLRRTCRVLLLSYPAAILIIPVLDATALRAIPRFGWIACAEICAALHVSLARYLYHVAMRIPRPDLAKEFRQAGWSVIIFGLFVLVLFGHFGASPDMAFVSLLPTLWLMVTVERMHSTLKSEAALANQSLFPAPRQ